MEIDKKNKSVEDILYDLSSTDLRDIVDTDQQYRKIEKQFYHNLRERGLEQLKIEWRL